MGVGPGAGASGVVGSWIGFVANENQEDWCSWTA